MSVTRVIRVVAGVALIGLLAYTWIPEDATGYEVGVALTVTGFIGGLLIGSWWSLGIVPATILATTWLWRQVRCAGGGCPPSQEGPPLWLGLLLAAGLYAISVLGAVVGTLAARWIARARRASRSLDR